MTASEKWHKKNMIQPPVLMPIRFPKQLEQVIRSTAFKHNISVNQCVVDLVIDGMNFNSIQHAPFTD